MMKLFWYTLKPSVFVTAAVAAVAVAVAAYIQHQIVLLL